MLQLTMNSDVAKFRQYMHMGGFEVMQVRLEWARNASAKERSYKNYLTSQSIAAISMVVTSVCGDRCPRRSLLVQLRSDTSLLREGTEGAPGASWRRISRLASARNAGVSQHVLLPRSPSPSRAPCFCVTATPAHGKLQRQHDLLQPTWRVSISGAKPMSSSLPKNFNN